MTACDCQKCEIRTKTESITCPPQTPCVYNTEKTISKVKDCKGDYKTEENKYYISEPFGYSEITETIVCD